MKALKISYFGIFIAWISHERFWRSESNFWGFYLPEEFLESAMQASAGPRININNSSICWVYSFTPLRSTKFANEFFQNRYLFYNKKCKHLHQMIFYSRNNKSCCVLLYLIVTNKFYKHSHQSECDKHLVFPAFPFSMYCNS